ncbi:hypothetical protein L914_11250 [Phytophthora nicotianae]|uniref:Uncharacterized protein n=1 Tax=Phytophthora nicotianae TaxID=4792 RepID=W2N3W2_PHYNI|nr:hypothetical protein L914_11250 [Phytophthora nicotianae]
MASVKSYKTKAVVQRHSSICGMEAVFESNALPISKALGPIDAVHQSLTDPNRLRAIVQLESLGRIFLRVRPSRRPPRLFPTDCKSSSSASSTSEFDPPASSRCLQWDCATQPANSCASSAHATRNRKRPNSCSPWRSRVPANAPRTARSSVAHSPPLS